MWKVGAVSFYFLLVMFLKMFNPMFDSFLEECGLSQSFAVGERFLGCLSHIHAPTFRPLHAKSPCSTKLKLCAS